MAAGFVMPRLLVKSHHEPRASSVCKDAVSETIAGQQCVNLDPIFVS